MRIVAVTLAFFVFLAPVAIADEAAEAKPEAKAADAKVEAKADPAKTAETAETEDTTAFEDLKSAVNKVVKQLPISFYGHFKLDSAYDSQRTNDGNTAMFVKKFKDDGRDDEFNMTARHTRVGFTYKAPESWGPKADAKLEIDFYGGGKENKGNLRLRHAYMRFVFEGGWEVLAGQTWDVAMPLLQKKLNTAVGWNQGNTAFRRPQLRGTKIIESDGATWKFEFSVNDPLATDIDGLGDDDAEDSGTPDFQARIGLSTHIFETKKPAVFGVNGIVGYREADLADGDEDYNTWLVGVDATLPVTDQITVLMEVFVGQALWSYNGGIAQDYNKVQDDGIETKGGFINVMWRPDKFWLVVVGAGVDDPDNTDLEPGNRDVNSSVFGNVRYQLIKNGWIGIEYDRMTTDYLSERDAWNNRFQMMFKLKW